MRRCERIQLSIGTITLLLVVCGAFSLVSVGCQATQTAKTDEKDAVIVDNSDKTAFSTKGIWMSDYGQGGENYGHDALWTYSNPEGAEVATWKPRLAQDGFYDVSVWYCGDPNDDHATDAPYTVKSTEGTRTVKLNLKENFGKWVSLGVYRMSKGIGGQVGLSSAANGNVVADAVRFEYVGETKP